jgi:hypothetical protein
MNTKQNNEKDGILKEIKGWPLEYVLLLLALALLLLGLLLFRILPDTVAISKYEIPILSSLLTLGLAAVANILVSFIQKGVSKQAARALEEPISRFEGILRDPFEKLENSVNDLVKIQLCIQKGVIGIYPDRDSAMSRFLDEIQSEDKVISFVGTSLTGALDPSEENEEKARLHGILSQKKQNGVKIRALLMHPAYGEFRERVENRGLAAVAIDIQTTLRYLVTTDEKDHQERLLTPSDVRLYPGVTTAFAIFTGRSMLVSLGSLVGPSYDNFTIIIEDTDEPKSIYKSFKSNHFGQPWSSEKTIRLDNELVVQLLETDFADDKMRFKEGTWPRPKKLPEPVAAPMSISSTAPKPQSPPSPDKKVESI